MPLDNASASTTDSEDDPPHIPLNVNASEIDSETMSKLRGDAIGDTLYSETFVVKTLMQLTDNMQWCEKLEDDLCFIWDMTLEKDVCEFLIKLSYPSMACTMINSSNEVRLIEILIGILANICCTSKNNNIVTAEELELILQVILSDDPLILIQVLRFIKAVCHNADTLPFITETLLEQIDFILNNSVNNELISNALDALSKIIVYNKLDATLLKGSFVKSSCVAYQTLCKNSEKLVIMSVFTHLIQIVSNICTYINELGDESSSHLLTDFNENSNDFLLELKQIFSYYTKREMLIPLEEEFNYIADASVSIFQISRIKYCGSLFKNIMKITKILIESNCEDINAFLELVCYFIFVGSVKEIVSSLENFKTRDINIVLNRIKHTKVEYQFNYEQNFKNLCEQYMEDLL